MNQEELRRQKRDIAQTVADSKGVTADHVRKVINGKRNDHHDITGMYMDLLEGKKELIEAVQKLVPFN